MRLLGSRALFAAREKQPQSYRDENSKRGAKHQMRQWGHSGLLAVIRDPEPCVGQLNGTGSTKVRRADVGAKRTARGTKTVQWSAIANLAAIRPAYQSCAAQLVEPVNGRARRGRTSGRCYSTESLAPLARPPLGQRAGPPDRSRRPRPFTSNL
jgi:hypothetical protein